MRGRGQQSHASQAARRILPSQLLPIAALLLFDTGPAALTTPLRGESTPIEIHSNVFPGDRRAYPRALASPPIEHCSYLCRDA